MVGEKSRLSEKWEKQVVIGYGATSFSAGLLQNLFLCYYLPLFLLEHKLSDGWFYAGEMVYLIVNSLNDPLLAYWMERREQKRERERGESHKEKDTRRVKREHIFALRYGGLFWVLSFLFMFGPFISALADGGKNNISSSSSSSSSFNLSSSSSSSSSLDPLPLSEQFKEAEKESGVGMITGALFILSLCLYDTFLSYVMLSHGALLADFTTSTSFRAKCNMASSVGGMIGSLSVFFSHWFWSLEDMSSFRIYTYFVGLFAICGFQITAYTFERYSQQILFDPLTQNDQTKSPKEKTGSQESSNATQIELWSFCKQLFSLRNFWIFVMINFIQVFNCHFFSNFMTIFLDEILPVSSSSTSSSSSSSSSLLFSENNASFLKMSILSSSAVLPHFLVLLFTRLLNRIGLYHLMQFMYGFKILLAFLFFWVGHFFFLDQGETVSSLSFIMLYMLVAKIFNEAICRHGNLVLADVVDEDKFIYQRGSSMSSLIFGINAFFTKPGQSLAPMFGWRLLSLFSSSTTGGTAMGISPFMIFFALIGVPVVCGCTQYFLWLFFSLHSNYLEIIKNQWKNV